MNVSVVSQSKKLYLSDYTFMIFLAESSLVTIRFNSIIINKFLQLTAKLLMAGCTDVTQTRASYVAPG